MKRLKLIRPKSSLLIKAALPLAVAGLAPAIPAQASSPSGSASTFAGRLLVAPLAAPGTSAASAAAAATCVKYATRAGWPNNGYFAGDLVTASAICVAESAGRPLIYVCVKNGQAVGQGTFHGDPVNCPSGTTSYDRGLWQLNSQAAKKVTDACAFNPVCNAGASYLASDRGTNFSPWVSYDQDLYAKSIDIAQNAVTKLTAGTITSALLGECLVQAKSAVNAKVVIANCGSGGQLQQWSVGGGKLRSGSVCAAIGTTSGNPKVVLRRCGDHPAQKWTVVGRSELRNAADGKCLTDPSGSLNAGTQVIVTRCTNAKAQVWWLP